MTEPYLHYTEYTGSVSHFTTIASLSTSSILLTPLPRLADQLKVRIPTAQSYVRQVSHAIAPSTSRLDEIYDREQQIGPSRIPINRDGSGSESAIPSRKGKERARGKWVSTGDEGLDRALGGGVRRGCLYELSGESASGKSHLALHLALAFQLPSLSSSPGGSLILTSERDLSTDRLVQLGQHLLVTHELSDHAQEHRARDLLDNILTNRIADVEALEHTLNYVVPGILESRTGGSSEPDSRGASSSAGTDSGQLPIRLLILDSITALFRGSTNANQAPSAHNAISLAERSKHLCIIADLLKSLAVKYDLAVLVINQVSDVFQRFPPPIANPLPLPLPNSQLPAYSFSQSSQIHTPIFTGLTDSQQPTEEAAMLYKTQSRWFSGENESLKKEAALGIVWANAINVRIMLSRTGRRRLMDQVDLTSHKRKKPNVTEAQVQSVVPGENANNQEDGTGTGDIKQTLIRKFHVVFSPFSAASTVDYVITSSGVHSLMDSYKKINMTDTVIRRKLRKEREDENENDEDGLEAKPRDGSGQALKAEHEERKGEWDEVFDDFGELPDEFWQGKYDLGVVDIEELEGEEGQEVQDRSGQDDLFDLGQGQMTEPRALIGDDADLFAEVSGVVSGVSENVPINGEGVVESGTVAGPEMGEGSVMNA
ncbi:uncharacterized protein I303_100548 [Kwoniella dejecticola CBS 10117]|uniref:RecA family profile 1 domain-containing protein n=1 Tax=Kwoniella dejecticola CBS 10117 TaxID=1296121 RepID=A0A1A6AF80_9TREE|nr:uncharacterized protein I303_00549 [Kwoniella dejecticola CBS 10117]OBR88732.1 hypothetical protein I303_00549 [Kwoniella dejecticola CBS 10117]